MGEEDSEYIKNAKLSGDLAVGETGNEKRRRKWTRNHWFATIDCFSTKVNLHFNKYNTYNLLMFKVEVVENLKLTLWWRGDKYLKVQVHF